MDEVLEEFRSVKDERESTKYLGAVIIPDPHGKEHSIGHESK